jgi:hypothetical protein
MLVRYNVSEIYNAAMAKQEAISESAFDPLHMQDDLMFHFLPRHKFISHRLSYFG